MRPIAPARRARAPAPVAAFTIPGSMTPGFCGARSRSLKLQPAMSSGATAKTTIAHRARSLFVIMSLVLEGLVFQVEAHREIRARRYGLEVRLRIGRVVMFLRIDTRIRRPRLDVSH